jgi:hypothetical protein
VSGQHFASLACMMERYIVEEHMPRHTYPSWPKPYQEGLAYPAWWVADTDGSTGGSRSTTDDGSTTGGTTGDIGDIGGGGGGGGGEGKKRTRDATRTAGGKKGENRTPRVRVNVTYLGPTKWGPPFNETLKPALDYVWSLMEEGHHASVTSSATARRHALLLPDKPIHQGGIIGPLDGVVLVVNIGMWCGVCVCVCVCVCVLYAPEI